MHLIVQLDDAWIFDIEIRKQNPLPGHDASMAEAAPGRVERDERGEARRAHTTPNGGPHLDLERLRLKTWSKSERSIAETTWPTYLYIYSYGTVGSVFPMVLRSIIYE